MPPSNYWCLLKDTIYTHFFLLLVSRVLGWGDGECKDNIFILRSKKNNDDSDKVMVGNETLLFYLFPIRRISFGDMCKKHTHAHTHERAEADVVPYHSQNTFMGNHSDVSQDITSG